MVDAIQGSQHADHLQEILTKHKTLVATFLQTNFDMFFSKYNTMLIQSESYVTKRQSIKLLGEILLDRANYNVMTQYVDSGDHLKIIMRLLRDDRKMINYEGFHVFKVCWSFPAPCSDLTSLRSLLQTPTSPTRCKRSSSATGRSYCASCQTSWKIGPKTSSSLTRRASSYGRSSSCLRNLLSLPQRRHRVLSVHRRGLLERSHGGPLTRSCLWQESDINMAFWIRDCDQAWSFFGIPQRSIISITGVNILSELVTLFWLILL